MSRRSARALTSIILKRLYVDKGLSMQDIADIYDVSRPAVYGRLKRFGIPIRDKSEARLQAIEYNKIDYHNLGGGDEDGQRDPD